MKSVKCIIIEDEFPAMEILKTYLSDIPNWEVAGEFTNAIDALTYLSEQQVDVIFLDIQLPRLSGINFIKTLKNPPLIVITSAYNEHAVEAFELVVFDYLLKPYPFERLIKTVSRINEQFSSPEKGVLAKTSDHILIKQKRDTIKILIANITYIESQREYVVITCKEESYRSKMSISKMEELLATHDFLRVHRSYLVPIEGIKSFSKKQINLEEHSIPIGRLYQKTIIERLSDSSK